MKSRYSGSICPKCKNKIMEGEEIEKPAGAQKWQHENCKAPSFTAQKYVAKREQAAAIGNFSLETLEAVFEGEVIDEDQPQKEFNPTPNQIAVFDFIRDPAAYCLAHDIPFSKHAVVIAVAGSGKTTTIVKGLDLTPKDAEVAFVAFNVHIADELKKRAPDHVYVSTLHSLGKLNLDKYIQSETGKKPEVEPDKVGVLLNDIWPVSKDDLQSGRITKNERRINYLKRFSMRSLVSISKSVLVDAYNKDVVLEMIDRYNIEIHSDYVDELVEKLPEILERCKKNLSMIDFDDMLWLPVVLDIDLWKLDYLMVDEAQDMNKCQIAFLLNSIKEDGRIIAVGDPNQSLYAFRGADSDAIPNIIEALQAITLPLSVTFRCPASHVRLAQRLVPEITARANAPEGEIIELDYFNLTRNLAINDLVICRTNGPLVRPAFECIRRGMKAVIRGKDIGASLINMIKGFGELTLNQFDVELGAYYEKEYTRLMDKSKEIQALLLQDKVETIRAIMAEVDTVPELINKISLLFDNKVSGIVFSSIHKAKGLEAENIFILRPDLMPHPRAQKDYEKQQELNCLYVAITRSKNKMYFVKGDDSGPMKGQLPPLLKA